MEAAAILLNAPSIWEKRKNYVNDDEGRDYNMCKALEDWAAEIRAEVMREKAAEIEQSKVELEQSKVQLKQKDAKIESMQMEIDMLRAQLASAVN
ncbi:MAG: hypothetical protein K5929_01605 [Lachnospiraceae bacterium]|nr:hypothetical protein [Lachnospiraceae bacterium]